MPRPAASDRLIGLICTVALLRSCSGTSVSASGTAGSSGTAR